MIKYAKIINQQTGLAEIGTGTNAEFYKSIGMTQLDVLQSDIDNAWYLTELCPMKTEDEKAKEEAERIAMLFLTGADVERGIYKAKGMDFEDIITYVEESEITNLDVKALKIELKANNFYRGNPYVDTIGNLLGLTKEQLDKFFEDGNYEHLLSITEEKSEIPINSDENIIADSDISSDVTVGETDTAQ